MKRLKYIILFLVALSFAYADTNGMQPDKPIITTWSKIKELFQ